MQQFPEWIQNSNGELVPFDADWINQVMFAATEALQKPNAFLARELTDGVLHFLSVEEFTTTPTAKYIGDVSAKVVRELGHPELALQLIRLCDADWRLNRAASNIRYESGERLVHRGPVVVEIPVDGSPEHFHQTCLSKYTLANVYSRDLQTAHMDGFLTICDTLYPNRLAGGTVAQTSNVDQDSEDRLAVVHLLQQLGRSTALYGSFIVCNGPEFLWGSTDAPDEKAHVFVELLKTAITVARLHVVVNLNIDPTPSWTGIGETGPLFAGADMSRDQRQHEAFRRAFLRLVAEDDRNAREAVGGDWRLALRVDYHFRADAPLPWSAISNGALAGWLRFVFDGSAKSPRLADGMRRSHSAVLSRVALQLPRLAAMDDVAGNASILLEKIPSLVRMAVSAGVQKRRYLRDQLADAARREFLLDRASLVVIPVGLEFVARQCNQRSSGKCDDDVFRFVLQIISTLQHAIQLESRRTNLEITLDNGCGLWFGRLSEFFLSEHSSPSRRLISGVTDWLPRAGLVEQASRSGQMQQLAGGGTAALFFDSHSLNLQESWDEIIAHVSGMDSDFRFRTVKNSDSQPQLAFEMHE